MKTYKGQPVKWAQYKYDGHRIRVERNHGVRCYTTTDIDIYEDLKHCAFMKSLFNLPYKAYVYGELYVPGEPASYVKSAIKKKEQLKFVVWNVPGFSCPEDQEDICTLRGLKFAEWRWLDYDWSVEELLEEAKQLNLEGWVLKGEEDYKIKVERTMDCIVTGIVDGKGRNLGLVGSLVVSVVGPNGEMIEVGNAGGMTDDERLLMDESDIGRICEVKYQYVGAKGRLRHPRFIRWREEHHDCSYEQDSKLCELLKR